MKGLAMRNTFGQLISVTLFGESHGPATGVVIDGLPAGIRVDRQRIAAHLGRRRGLAKVSTPRREADAFEIESGMLNDTTTGTPLTLLLRNNDVKDDTTDHAVLPRPGHADYAQLCRYGAGADLRGGGHSSGRLTAPLVAAGAIVSGLLESKGILIGAHIGRLHGIEDRPFVHFNDDIALLHRLDLPVLDDSVKEKMIAQIRTAAEKGDSVGGRIDAVITGLPEGVGEPFFDTIEGVLSHILFAIPAVKGVSFGDGFALADRYGSDANDAFVTDNGRVTTHTLHGGGVGGGISYGAPILFSCAVKPTPSVAVGQSTVNLSTLAPTVISSVGRNDPAIVHRACPVVEAVAALAVADLLAQRFGCDYLRP